MCSGELRVAAYPGRETISGNGIGIGRRVGLRQLCQAGELPLAVPIERLERRGQHPGADFRWDFLLN